MADTTAAARKRKQRQREKESGMKSITFQVMDSFDARLESMLAKRGYDKSEYIALLIHRDMSQFEKSIQDLGDCQKCGQAKSFGSDCAFQGMAECWETIERKQLVRVNA